MGLKHCLSQKGFRLQDCGHAFGMEFHYFRFQQGFGIGVFFWSCSLLFHSSYLTDEIGDIF